MADTGLTIEELAGEAGVSVRTVRYYVAEGLLPGPGARGKAASYGPEHLARLRLIRTLVERRVPLAEQKQQLADLSADEVDTLLRAEQVRGAQLREAPSPRAYVAALLDRTRRTYRHADGSAPPPPVSSPPPQRAAAGRVRSSAAAWRRWELAPGVELHARADAAVRQRGLIERLLRAAEDPRSAEDPRNGTGTGSGGAE